MSPAISPPVALCAEAYMFVVSDISVNVYPTVIMQGVGEGDRVAIGVIDGVGETGVGGGVGDGVGDTGVGVRDGVGMGEGPAVSEIVPSPKIWWQKASIGHKSPSEFS